MNLTGKIIEDTYYIKDLLGEDSFTRKWKAISVLSDTDIKLTFLKHPNKDLNKTFINSLKIKMQSYSQVIHHGLAKIYNIGEYNDHIYISSEFVKGVSLADYWKTAKTKNIIEIVYIIIQISKAIEYAHKKKCYHGNLNLYNIWILEHLGKLMEIKIADLGYSSYLYPPENKDTHKNNILENLTNQNKTTEIQRDISSIGAIFYWMLTGKKPETIDSRGDIVQPSAIKSEIPHIVDTIVMQMLKNYSDDGFQKISEYQKYLSKICSGEKIDDTHFTISNLYHAKEKLVTPPKVNLIEKIKLKFRKKVQSPITPKVKTSQKSLGKLFSPQIHNQSPKYIKELFYNACQSKGNIYLIDHNTVLKYSNLFDYYYYYIGYNGGLFKNISYSEEKFNYEFSLFHQILNTYNNIIMKFDSSERFREKDQLYNKLGNQLKKNPILFANFFDHFSGSQANESEINITDDLLKEMAQFFFHLIKIKSPLILLIDNIEKIDNSSNLLLAELNKNIGSYPILIIGIYTSYGKTYDV